MREGRAVGEGDELGEGVGALGAAEEGGVAGLVVGGVRWWSVEGVVGSGGEGGEGKAAEWWEGGGHCCVVWCGGCCGWEVFFAGWFVGGCVVGRGGRRSGLEIFLLGVQVPPPVVGPSERIVSGWCGVVIGFSRGAMCRVVS